MVVTWWIITFLHSELSVLTNKTAKNSQELSKDHLRNVSRLIKIDHKFVDVGYCICGICLVPCMATRKLIKNCERGVLQLMYNT